MPYNRLLRMTEQRELLPEHAAWDADLCFTAGLVA